MPNPYRSMLDAIDEAAGPSAAEQAAALLPLVYNPDTLVAGMVAAANEAATPPHERAAIADIVRELRD